MYTVFEKNISTTKCISFYFLALEAISIGNFPSFQDGGGMANSKIIKEYFGGTPSLSARLFPVKELDLKLSTVRLFF